MPFLCCSLASSFSISHDTTLDRSPPIPAAERDTIHAGEPGLLPALQRVRFDFGAAALVSEPSAGKEIAAAIGFSATPGTRKGTPPLVLKRRDGVVIYGREIMHSVGDVKDAILSFLNEEKSDGNGTNDPVDPALWDATLLLVPDDEPSEGTVLEGGISETGGGSSMPSVAGDAVTENSESSCFVAMNRFRVKEDCKFLFEDRWAQRKSKLSHQPGFLVFSLLRRTNTEARTTNAQESSPEQEDLDSFNYSTCTIWDSEDSWERWRNGGGRTSHEASRKEGTTRVPVSEWLEGPSSPIFWDGKKCTSTSNTRQQ